jgi:hypothetical protein
MRLVNAQVVCWESSGPLASKRRKQCGPAPALVLDQTLSVQLLELDGDVNTPLYIRVHAACVSSTSHVRFLLKTR